MLRKTFSVVLFCVILTAIPAFALTEEEANAFAEQAYEKAKTLSKGDDITLASMYFINALSFNPGRMDIITDYVSAIIERAEKDTTLPADTLDALDNFLNAQIMTVKPDDLPKIIELREEISETQEKMMSAADGKDSAADAAEKAEKELKGYKSAALNAKGLKEYKEALQAAQNLMEEFGISDNRVTNSLQAALMTDAAVKQIAALLASSKDTALEPLQTYYLQLAESSLQQIAALSVKLPPEVRKELVFVKDTVEKRISEISYGRSAAVMRKIYDEYNSTKEDIKSMGYGTIQQNKIDRLNEFVQSITALSQGITSEKHSVELRGLMNEVQKQLLEYRAEQEKKYNRWAMDQIEGMMKDNEVNLRNLLKFKTTDEAAICRVMIRYLPSIDTRLLNFGASHCFNKVYEEYYGKLDDAHQKEIDRAMAYDKKRGLSEF